MNIVDRYGPERVIFVDEETGRTVWRMTNSQREDKHTYYDICPWSPDQKYILFSSADPKDLTIEMGNTLASKNGSLHHGYGNIQDYEDS